MPYNIIYVTWLTAYDHHVMVTCHRKQVDIDRRDALGQLLMVQEQVYQPDINLLNRTDCYGRLVWMHDSDRK